MLELYEGKPSRTVLRRESGSNPADLAGEAYRYGCEQAVCMSHYSCGILAAAEALGIDRDELVEAAEVIGVEKGLQDES